MAQTLSTDFKNLNFTEKQIKQIDKFQKITKPQQENDIANLLNSLKISKKDSNDSEVTIKFEQYKNESQLPALTKLISKDLSEPYSVYTYRYFLHCWPDLSFIAVDAKNNKIIGVIICKVDTINESVYLAPKEDDDSDDLKDDLKGLNNQDTVKSPSFPYPINNTSTNIVTKRGYIGMLAIDDNYRRLGIACNLVELSIAQLHSKYNCNQIMLETEVTNNGALMLYDSLGFIREERLYRYYLNGQDAFRLILYVEDDGWGRWLRINTKRMKI